MDSAAETDTECVPVSGGWGGHVARWPAAFATPASQFGHTPVQDAAANGHGEVVCALLDRGADLEARDSDGCTPLLAAARFGKAKVVRLLVERGADTEASNRFGQDALASCLDDASAELISSAERLQRWHRRRVLVRWNRMKPHCFGEEATVVVRANAPSCRLRLEMSQSS
mmetsp:Transcript_3808/g.15811  ORF Transcript_3808/g.15811 Transcript_3808/m.15811 type:complete len:171 (-) Transcript_3808:66-578(-)